MCYTCTNTRRLTLQPDILRRANYMATLFWLPSSPKSIPSTKLIQFFSAGTNHVSSHPVYTDSEIPLCSANGVHGPQIAEWVIMMDLVHSHSYTKLYDNQKKKIWNQADGSNVSDRVGKKVGILGYGSIGRQGMLITSSRPGHANFLGDAETSPSCHMHSHDGSSFLFFFRSDFQSNSLAGQVMSSHDRIDPFLPLPSNEPMFQANSRMQSLA